MCVCARARVNVCVCVCVCVILEDRPEVDVDLLVALNHLQVVGSLTQSLFLNAHSPSLSFLTLTRFHRLWTAGRQIPQFFEA